MNMNVVIIGAGQAGVSAAMSLREFGWEGGIHLVGEEDRTPYQRPPLSKAYLSGIETSDDLVIASEQVLFQKNIETYLGVQVVRVQRILKIVELSDGTELPYHRLIFATGSTPRQLELPGSELSGLFTIRDIQDADALRDSFANGGDTVLIGGGFLNLEVAIECLKYGSVTVLEVAPQILGRALSRPAANVLQNYHENLGVQIRCDIEIERILGKNGEVVGVRLTNGEIIDAARVVVSVGASARDELAAASGLNTANGIIVDGQMRTNDDCIFAIGDCAMYPNVFSETSMRVESVQNATDHARFVAAYLTDNSDGAYQAVPWFWSNQGGWRLQIAGLALPADETKIVVRDMEQGKLVVERWRSGQLVAVESINSPREHMKARKALAKSQSGEHLHAYS